MKAVQVSGTWWSHCRELILDNRIGRVEKWMLMHGYMVQMGGFICVDQKDEDRGPRSIVLNNSSRTRHSNSQTSLEPIFRIGRKAGLQARY